MPNIAYGSRIMIEDGSPSPAFQSSLAPTSPSSSTSSSTSTSDTPPTELMLRDEQESLGMDMDSVVRDLKLELAGVVTTSVSL